jgi:hypothetical protein
MTVPRSPNVASIHQPIGEGAVEAHHGRMKTALAYALAILVLALIAPAIAWLGSKQGRRARGGIALMIFGLGQVTDPPSKHLIEAQGGEEKESETSGEPKETSHHS